MYCFVLLFSIKYQLNFGGLTNADVCSQNLRQDNCEILQFSIRSSLILDLHLHMIQCNLLCNIIRCGWITFHLCLLCFHCKGCFISCTFKSEYCAIRVYKHTEHYSFTSSFSITTEFPGGGRGVIVGIANLRYT